MDCSIGTVSAGKRTQASAFDPSSSGTRSWLSICAVRTSTSIAPMPSTGTAIIATINALRPRERSASRRATRKGHPPPGDEAHRATGRVRKELLGPGHRTRLVDREPVAQEHDPVRPGRVPCLVRDEHAGSSGVAALAEQAKDGLPGLGVESTGRLVREDQSTLPHERPGDGDALLLPAGHVVGEPVRELGEVDLGQRGQRLAARSTYAQPVELSREADVLGCRQRRDEVEVLEDVPDLAPAQDRTTPLVELGDRLSLHDDVTARRRCRARPRASAAWTSRSPTAP